METICTPLLRKESGTTTTASMFASMLVFLVFGAPTASATVIDTLTTGKPLPVAASAAAKAEAVKLATQGGVDFIAALSGHAWTWDYAYAFPRQDQQNDTTLNVNIPALGIIDTFNNPDVAHALADKGGFFGRHATAEGTATLVHDNQGHVIDGTKEMSTNTNRFAVAKSITGIGTDFETEGARLGAVIVAKIINIALDPPIPNDIPGPSILEPLPPNDDFSDPTFTLPMASKSSPAGFEYVVGYIDPNGLDHPLLDFAGSLVFDDLMDRWTVDLVTSVLTAGTSGLPVANDFNCSGTKCEYNPSLAAKIMIPFHPESTWSDDSTFSIYSRFGIFAQSADIPEPGTLSLIALGLGWFGMRRVRDASAICKNNIAFQ